MHAPHPHRVEPGTSVNLDDIKADDDGGLDEDEAKEQFNALRKRLTQLQELLYAEAKHAVLIVLQAMDAGGKDSTIRKVFGVLNPQGVRVWNFKQPTGIELAHDFLWRVHERTPAKGYINIFNRSHYEDVVIVRVRELVKAKRWRQRYEHINAFEHMLHDEGTTILKFYLHITKGYQKRRMLRRLDRPDKHWKFNPADLKERQRWPAYQKAYEEAISRCSTDWAPWYIVSAEKHWHRNLVIAQTVVSTLESLDLQFPPLDFDPGAVVID